MRRLMVTPWEGIPLLIATAVRAAGRAGMTREKFQHVVDDLSNCEWRDK